MALKRCAMLLCLFIAFAPLAAAESALSFPCDPELSPFLAAGTHEISREIDLAACYRMRVDNGEDDALPVESGSLIVLDMQFMIISLRFSKDFDYEAAYMHLPEEIMLVNVDPNIDNDTGTPLWCVTIYPDADDPYSFHYAGTWNPSMACVRFYGSHVNAQRDQIEGFSFQVAAF